MAIPRINIFRGKGIRPYLDDLARLRIDVFRAWPYLYLGDVDYERGYLATYAASPRSLFVLATDGDRVIGASTGVPLVDEMAAFWKPFEKQGFSADTIFYFGESVLLPEYRGLGLGHRFFDEREAYARAQGFAVTAFCSVVRAVDDPRCPESYRSNDVFWTKRGYRPRPEMRCQLDWLEVGAAQEATHELSFWLRDLEMVE